MGEASTGSATIIFLFLLGVVLGTIITIIGFSVDSKKETRQLGQSICEEEHHMDFKSYSDGVLECKPAPEEEKYDGIKVRIVGGKE